MRVLNSVEMNSVTGAGDIPPPPPVGVSQWEWNQLLALQEEQRRRDAHQQN